MKVGIPREVKNHEYRVAITPAGVHELVRARPRGVRRAGRRASARRSPTTSTSPRARTILADRRRRLGHRRPDPQGQGADRGGVPPAARGPDAVHLPAPGRVQRVHRRAARAPASPPSPTRPSSCRTARCRCSPRCREVAGRLAPQVGAHHLMRAQGGRGVLMGGVSGVYAAKVVVIGAGVSGMNAAAIALGMQAEVLAARPATSSGCARSTGSTRATCRPSRPTPTRSSGPCWTPTW